MKAIDIKCACIERISSRKDRSISFGVSTPELTPDQAAAFLGLHGLNCRIMLQPLDVEADAFIEVKSELEQKSPSSRQRSVLFLIWKGTGSSGQFSEYYTKRMETMIDRLKKELDDL